MLCRNTIFIMALAATSCNAFWWGSETREVEPQPQPVVKPIPVGYFRTFTYQPVTFNPQPSPYYSYQASAGPGLATTKMIQPNQFYGWQHPKQYPAPMNQPMSLSSTIYGTLPFQAQQSQQSTQMLHPSAASQSSPSPFNINSPSSISSNGNNMGLSSSQLPSVQNQVLSSSPSQLSSSTGSSSSSSSSASSSAASQSNANNINSVSIEPQQLQQLPSQQLSHQIPMQPFNQFLSDNHLPSTAPAQFNQQLLQQQQPQISQSQQLPQSQQLTQLPQQLQPQQLQPQQLQQPQQIGSGSMFGNIAAQRQIQFPSTDPQALPSSSYYSNAAPQMPSTPSTQQQTVAAMPQVQFVPCMCPITVGLPPEVLVNKRNDELLLTIPAEFTTSREAVHESQSQVLEQLQQHQQKTQQQQESQPQQQTEDQ